MERKEIINSIYFDKYKAEKKTGEGSFGTIYRGILILIKD